MAKYKRFKLLSFFLVLALLQSPAFNLFADDGDQRFSGRVFDLDKKTPLADVTVQIVSTETGQSRATKTNKNGCYDFKNVAVGTYTLSVNQGGTDLTDFTLPNKIKMNPDLKVMACVALAQNNALEITPDACRCKEFPWLVIVLGTGPAAALLVCDCDAASPSRP